MCVGRYARHGRQQLFPFPWSCSATRHADRLGEPASGGLRPESRSPAGVQTQHVFWTRRGDAGTQHNATVSASMRPPTFRPITIDLQRRGPTTGHQGAGCLSLLPPCGIRRSNAGTQSFCKRVRQFRETQLPGVVHTWIASSNHQRTGAVGRLTIYSHGAVN